MHVDNVSEPIDDGENLPPYLHAGMIMITYPPSPPFPRDLPFRPSLNQTGMCAIFLSFSRDYENKGERHSPISEPKGIRTPLINLTTGRRQTTTNHKATRR